MKTIHTDQAPAAVGPYSQAIEANGVLYCSGQIAINPAEGKIVATTIEEQAEQCCRNVEAVLKEAGIREVVALDHRFPLEYCDDCGAPLYPNPDGEPSHAELPEEQAEAAPRHLH